MHLDINDSRLFLATSLPSQSIPIISYRLGLDKQRLCALLAIDVAIFVVVLLFFLSIFTCCTASALDIERFLFNANITNKYSKQVTQTYTQVSVNNYTSDSEMLKHFYRFDCNGQLFFFVFLSSVSIEKQLEYNFRLVAWLPQFQNSTTYNYWH